jgi:phosphoribosylaminoimidazolecarboxamide formyltransferase/IMP cyclohydrolase
VKHTTPCGLGLGDTLAKAYAKALATDPTSAFGSVISTNRPVDAATADLMSTLFIECIVAPGFEDDALSILTQKKNVRLLVYPAMESFGAALDEPQGAGEGVPFLAAFGRAPTSLQHRSVYGGLLVQTAPTPPWYIAGAMGGFEVATQRAPTDAEWDDLRFAWSAIFGVKSNAILLARDGGVLGIGAGQMSRVDSSKIAVRKAGEAGHDLKGAVLASDAFFPFRDGVDAAAESGVAAIIQPGGAMRDKEVIAAADARGMAMVFTGRRHFRH